MMLVAAGFTLSVLASAWLLHLVEPGDRPTRRAWAAAALILAIICAAHMTTAGLLEGKRQRSVPPAPAIMCKSAA